VAKKVLVRIWAKQYENSRPLADAEITDMHTGESWRTGADGYAEAEVEAGRTLSLKFNKASYPEVQAGSVKVPAGGLKSENREITLQVPGSKLYKALRVALGSPKTGTHHVVTTVSAAGKNLHDDLGEEGVVVTLRSADRKTSRNDAIYLGTVLGKTEWLRPIAAERLPGLKRLKHKSTSHDGGAIFKNVPPGEYVLEARKTGADGKPLRFTRAKVTVFENSPELINVSPPHSPHVVARKAKSLKRPPAAG
jgi:hypothetical protein